MCDSRRPVGADSDPIIEMHVEGVSVLVVAPNEETARLMAPEIARREYPGRDLGPVLFAEWVGGEHPGYECVVQAVPDATPRVAELLRAAFGPRPGAGPVYTHTFRPSVDRDEEDVE